MQFIILLETAYVITSLGHQRTYLCHCISSRILHTLLEPGRHRQHPSP